MAHVRIGPEEGARPFVSCSFLKTTRFLRIEIERRRKTRRAVYALPLSLRRRRDE